MDALWVAVAVGGLAVGAWLVWLLARPPRCPACGVRSQAQATEPIAHCPPVSRVTFYCRPCGRIVARRLIGEWD